MTNKFRGNYIIYRKGAWVYSDTLCPVHKTWREKPCGICGDTFTKVGHDACLGALEGVKNACCGHGKTKEAYVQFDNGHRIDGNKALDYFKQVHLNE